jgi:DNA (cytosine-5)-methyltransferase 1
MLATAESSLITACSRLLPFSPQGQGTRRQDEGRGPIRGHWRDRTRLAAGGADDFVAVRDRSPSPSCARETFRWCSHRSRCAFLRKASGRHRFAYGWVSVSGPITSRDDERDFGQRSGLVRNVFRLIAKSRPPWVLIENVPFLLRLDGGRGMSYVVRSLERLGYRWAYRVLDTRAFGLPHRRERVFLLASLVDNPADYLHADDESPKEAFTGAEVAHGFYWTEGNRGLGWAVDAVPTIKGGSSVGIPSPPAIWFSDGRFATPDIRDAERLQGFPANWTRPAETAGRPSYRWRMVGNAVSVPVARWIGRKLLARPTRNSLVSPVKVITGAPWPRAAFGGPKLGRFAVNLGTFPVARARRHLHEFLKFEPWPLSRRAADGFRRRLQRSSLTRPAEFDDDLNAYVEITRSTR